MKSEIKYIEQKNGFSDKGPAWIGLVSYSKSGKTLYFDGKALQSLKGARSGGNYFDIETNDEYWISSVKKDMSDRHWAGGGKIFVEKRILNDYLQIIDRTKLPKSDYELTDVKTEIPIERIYEFENQTFEPIEFGRELYSKKPNELTEQEILFLLIDLEKSANSPQYKKTRRSINSRRIELEAELDKRGIKNVG